LATSRIANITERGARSRRRHGWIALIVAGGVLLALVVLEPPRAYRLLLGIPVGIAALNFIQAREKT
jgi:hypothetical protein